MLLVYDAGVLLLPLLLAVPTGVGAEEAGGTAVLEGCMKIMPLEVATGTWLWARAAVGATSRGARLMVPVGWESIDSPRWLPS